MQLKNRLVMPPMVRDYAEKNGHANDRYVAHIESIARGGVGMMILEASYVMKSGQGFPNELGIHEDAVVPGLKRLVKAAHKYGAKIGVQLYHAGRQTHQAVTGMPIVAPSTVPDPSSGEMPVALTAKEIQTLVEAYAAGARRAKEAGMDFVEIHGAHGYLITQFLSPFSNHRKDSYGGTPEKRFRFLQEVYEAVRDEVCDCFPVIVRLSGAEDVKGGLMIKDTVKIAQKLEDLGVDGLHISSGNYASYAQGRMISPMAVKDGVLVDLAAAVKKHVKIPVITVNKIRTPELAEKILKAKKADYVAIGRTLLADPEWPNKVAAGQLDKIMPCIACNQACIGRLFAGQDVLCTVNPTCGRELEFAKKPGKSKKIIVVGGGPAGMQAAKTAAMRGHKVTLFEAKSKLGGQMYAAGAAPHRNGWVEFRKALIRDLGKLHITLKLNKTFGLSDVKALKPDAVVLAIGSSPSLPGIPGIDRENVVTARDLLEGKSKATGSVVVIGGGCAGAQTAEYLAVRKHKVAIVEFTKNIAMEAPPDDRNLLLGRLTKLGVKINLETKVTAIGEKSVTVEDSKGTRTIPANTIVLCLGSRSNDGLQEELKGVVKSVQVVGDALKISRMNDAVAEGALAILAIESGK